MKYGIEENCKFLRDDKRDCKILKQLYCKVEPCKKCAWYKEKEKEKVKPNE